MNPSPVLERVDGILVVRDDLLPGGTKARILPLLLDGATEVVYASPVTGYAQVAIAIVAQRLGVRATIFCAARQRPHALTLAAARAGAQIRPVAPGYLTVVQARARQYCAVARARWLPFGLDTPATVAALAAVARALPIVPPGEVWSVAGSGMLTRALQAAWPAAVVHAVQIGGAPAAGRATLHRAPERFEQPAHAPPPFPSCSTYDAKAWQFVLRHATRPGALFWNVA